MSDWRNSNISNLVLMHSHGQEIHLPYMREQNCRKPCIAIFTSVTPEVVEVYHSYFKKTQKFICVSHFLYTAQNLLAQTVASGGKLSKTAENLAYLNDGEIPAHLIDRLNIEIQLFAGNIAVCRSDVSRYINYYMKKYADTIDWNVFQEVTGKDSKDDPVQFTGFEKLAASEAPIPLNLTAQGPPKVKLKVLGCSSKSENDSCSSSDTLRVNVETGHSEPTETQLF